MSLEQLALIFILKNMGRVEDVKKHLVASLRELTLAMVSSLGIINQTASEHNLGRKFPIAETLLKKFDTLLQYAAEKIPAQSDADRLKTEVLASVIDILDEESERLAGTPAPLSELQREALTSIRRALTKRMAGTHERDRKPDEAVKNDAVSTRKNPIPPRAVAS